MSVDQVAQNPDPESSLSLQVIDVLDFNHESDRKCKRPIHVEALVEVLKRLFQEGDQETITAKSISKLHKHFCKKNTATNVKKNFKCKSCSCLIESVDALVAHVKGAKHVQSIKDYKPYREEKQVDEPKKREEIDICLTLEEHLKGSKEPLIGLSHVQEFISTEVPTAYRMYKCMLFECDGAWGTSYDFPFHLFSPDHLKSFLGEVVKLNTSTISKLSPEDLISEASKHSNSDFGQLQRIEDEERWKIQSCRLASRSIGRVRRNHAKQVKHSLTV